MTKERSWQVGDEVVRFHSWGGRFSQRLKVERVTPTGIAVLSDGRTKLRPCQKGWHGDKWQAHERGESRNLWRLLTDEMLAEESQLADRQRLSHLCDRKHREALTDDQTRRMLAIFDEVTP